jgi:hypothetical protein
MLQAWSMVEELILDCSADDFRQERRRRIPDLSYLLSPTSFNFPIRREALKS